MLFQRKRLYKHILKMESLLHKGRFAAAQFGSELANLLNDIQTKANVKNCINFDNARDVNVYHNLTGLS